MFDGNGGRKGGNILVGHLPGVAHQGAVGKVGDVAQDAFVALSRCRRAECLRVFTHHQDGSAQSFDAHEARGRVVEDTGPRNQLTAVGFENPAS